jgi:hypothetical protein
MVKQAGDEFVADQRLDRWPAKPDFPPWMMRCMHDRLRRQFGLKNRRHGLRAPRQPAFYPAKLRRVERW